MLLLGQGESSPAKRGKGTAAGGGGGHSAGEYIRTGGFHHTNTVESHFALLKRGVFGTFQNISEAHLGRYLVEFDFCANTRHLTDSERCGAILSSAKGKRLMYRQLVAAKRKRPI